MNPQRTLIGLSWLAMTPLLVGQDYRHFEARHVHPVALTPDGIHLLAVHSPASQLSVFSVADATQPAPVLLREIGVGLEPVSVRARTADEVWVVSEVSDSVSIVSLSLGAVVETLACPDEPADVVFAGGKAFVTCARSREMRVFDATTRAPLQTIALQGEYPRALAVSADETKVYAAFQLSGNGTTVIPANVAPAQPPPTNATLSAPPDTPLIVPVNDPRVPYTVLDRDVAEIDVSSGVVTRYLQGVGTHLFDLALRPGTQELWVANSEALNQTRFEPALRGHFIDHRLTKVTLTDGGATAMDLNPGLDYQQLPNPTALGTALAQPEALVFADATTAWVAAFASDKVAKVNAGGVVLTRVDLRPPGVSSRGMRGPRGLALSADGSRLYVLNKLTDTVSVIDTAMSTLLAEVRTSSNDPMPAAIREGRGFLFDARLSGNGTMACGSCHLDADHDGLGWDLGDPGGQMTTVMGANLSAHDTTPRERTLHPMKGPLVTQSLRGLQRGQLMHWRGDRPNFESFNVTYDDLLGGAQIAAADMQALTDYIFTLGHHPNPYRSLNRAMPATIGGDDPNAGRLVFLNVNTGHCIDCHALPTGSDNNIDLLHEVGSTQSVKTPPLRTVYQRTGFFTTPGSVNTRGFGLLKDGTGNAAFLPTVHSYVLANFETIQQMRDVAAYVLAFDTGTAPAVGAALTVTTLNRATTEVGNHLATMEVQAIANCNFIVRGTMAGRSVAFLYDPTLVGYRSESPDVPALSRSALLSLLVPGDAITFYGVAAGQGLRLSIDRDADGLLNAAEPKPLLRLEFIGSQAQLIWSAESTGWLLEQSLNLTSPWEPVSAPPQALSQTEVLQLPAVSSSPHFFRLRRTW